MALPPPALRWLLLLPGPGVLSRGLASEGPREPLPVIRVPQLLKLRRGKGARGDAAPRVTVQRPGPLLIAARRPEFNQPARLTVGRWQSAPLASRGWKHRRSRGDHFSIERTARQVPAFPTEPEAEKAAEAEAGAGFAGLGLQPRVLEALQQAAPAIVRPTWVQLRAVPQLLRGRHLLCAAETGSGKTLSYLLPLLQRLLGQPMLATSCPAPHGLVLVPSRELAEQVRAVAGPLGQALQLCVREIGGGRGMGSVRRQLALQPPANVLVATPGALWKALKGQLLSLEHLRFLVLDEADTLLDESFLELVQYIVDKSPVAEDPAELEDPFNPKTQLVLVGATFPKGVGELLSRVTPLSHLSTVTSPKLHCLLPHVEQRFLRLKGVEKVTELIEALKLHAEAGPGHAEAGPGLAGAVLVFCNSSSTVNWLGYILDDHKIPHLRLQGQMPAAMRAGIFRSFQNGFRDVLLCTDIASRGLDSTRVQLVINYDFPPTLQDYIHRAGRVGRVGSEQPGSVISFVTHPWDVELVQKIELAARRRRNLPGIKKTVPIELTG